MLGGDGASSGTLDGLAGASVDSATAASNLDRCKSNDSDLDVSLGAVLLRSRDGRGGLNSLICISDDSERDRRSKEGRDGRSRDVRERGRSSEARGCERSNDCLDRVMSRLVFPEARSRLRRNACTSVDRPSSFSNSELLPRWIEGFRDGISTEGRGATRSAMVIGAALSVCASQSARCSSRR